MTTQPSIGATVVHCMGHVGTVVAFDGPFVVLVDFVNTMTWVSIEDIEIHPDRLNRSRRIG